MDVGAEPDIWQLFSRCTVEARRAISHARQCLTDLGGDALSPEHLLCGLLKADVLASRHLVALPMTAEEISDRFADLFGAVVTKETTVDVPLSDETTRALNRAWAEAESLGHRKIRSDQACRMPH
jgi:ATP-dependent Clp protease ATP-binding subunit ClpA